MKFNLLRNFIYKIDIDSYECDEDITSGLVKLVEKNISKNIKDAVGIYRHIKYVYIYNTISGCYNVEIELGENSYAVYKLKDEYNKGVEVPIITDDSIAYLYTCPQCGKVYLLDDILKLNTDIVCPECNNEYNHGVVRILRPGKYRHFKGEYYEVMGITEYMTNTEQKIQLVVYKQLFGNEMYCMDIKEFASKLDNTKYPNAYQEYRFERIDD